jgi:hypothetical protein
MAGAFIFCKRDSEEIMNRESEEYRLARIEAYRITLARLGNQFCDKAVNLEKMQEFAASELANEAHCAPWRQSETERAGCREGMRIAAAEFLSQYQKAMRDLILSGTA